jgi:hypothetical protein
MEIVTDKETESGIQAVTWSAIEVNIGIICASLIALKPLLVHFYPCLLEETDIPSHCMRLPIVQTSSEDDTMSPISQVSPSLARVTTGMTSLHRPSIVAILPGLPQSERMSLVGLLTNGLVPESQRREKNIR